jgi:hypothetical protein
LQASILLGALQSTLRDVVAGSSRNGMSVLVPDIEKNKAVLWALIYHK